MHKLTFILLIIGGLNWLLMGILQEDLFGLLNMEMTATVARIVYVLVGLSAVYEIIAHKSLCKNCTAPSA